MRRLILYLVNLLLVLLLLLSAGGAATWVRSYWAVDQVRFEGLERSWDAAVERGTVHWRGSLFVFPPGQTRFPGGGSQSIGLFVGPWSEWELEFLGRPPVTRTLGFGSARFSDKRLNGYGTVEEHHWVLAAPMWAVLGVPLAMSGGLFDVRRRLRRSGAAKANPVGAPRGSIRSSRAARWLDHLCRWWCVGTVLAWAWSIFFLHNIYWEDSRGYTGVSSEDGTLTFSSDRRARYQDESADERSSGCALTSLWWRLDVGRPAQAWRRVLGRFGYERIYDDGSLRRSPRLIGFSLDLPFWPIFLAAAALPSWHALGRWRLRRRLASGRCQICGYDLRGSTGSPRCPECGEAVTHK